MIARTKFMSITYGMDDTPTRLYYPALDFVKTKPPGYSITGRHYLPEMSTRIPGPGRYYNENVNVHLRTAPKVTMGIRHSELCSTGLPAHQKLEEND